MRNKKERVSVYKESYEELERFRNLHLKTEIKEPVSQEDYFKALETVRCYLLHKDKVWYSERVSRDSIKELEEVSSAVGDYDDGKYRHGNLSSSLYNILYKELGSNCVVLDLKKLDIRVLRGTKGFGDKMEEVLMGVAKDAGIELFW